jgi:ATP-dependent HslUV protease ATP-binding subunit HslU
MRTAKSRTAKVVQRNHDSEYVLLRMDNGEDDISEENFVLNNKNPEPLKDEKIVEEEKDFSAQDLMPKQMKEELDKFIIGQDDAKKAISVAFRNRWRSLKLNPEIRSEIVPKNILMVGSTGIGKTEISRRVAKLAGAPFIKVEATQYTEVGFKGKDVNSMIEQLLVVAIKMENKDFKFVDEEEKKVNGFVFKREMPDSQMKARAATIAKAIKNVEEKGIIFIDEIDKICRKNFSSSDASDEGVQRDLLPLIEGTSVTTKFGDVNTDNILFIAAGAFSKNRPSDLIAELRGRLPIRVDLKPLGQHEIYRILKEPENNLVMQNIELFKTENVDLRFTDEALDKMAEYAALMNEKIEDIGARRLFAITESVLEDFSFKTKKLIGSTIVIDREYVSSILQKFFEDQSHKRYIL